MFRRVKFRHMVMRGSLALNVVLLLYLTLPWFSTTSTSSTPYSTSSLTFTSGLRDRGADATVKVGVEKTEGPTIQTPATKESKDSNLPLDFQERKIISDCRRTHPRYQQRGDYWFLENYIPASMTFHCNESITYSTHGDYTFLDNLEPLISRWQGPVSMTTYAPGVDFEVTINAILYLRDCRAKDVKKYVSFHVFFPVTHIPREVPSTEELLRRQTNCDLKPTVWSEGTTFRHRRKLSYPVNIARNIARQASHTYFVLPSDVELYPSVNFIPEFFKMLGWLNASDKALSPRVYVLPVFEVEAHVPPPKTKAELQELLLRGDAIPFHKHICASCHTMPLAEEWMAAPAHPGLSVFHVAKRQGPFQMWEPIYVGTNMDPLYDERLSWLGKRDKMTQMYIL